MGCRIDNQNILGRFSSQPLHPLDSCQHDATYAELLHGGNALLVKISCCHHSRSSQREHDGCRPVGEKLFQLR